MRCIPLFLMIGGLALGWGFDDHFLRQAVGSQESNFNKIETVAENMPNASNPSKLPSWKEIEQLPQYQKASPSTRDIVLSSWTVQKLMADAAQINGLTFEVQNERDNEDARDSQTAAAILATAPFDSVPFSSSSGH